MKSTNKDRPYLVLTIVVLVIVGGAIIGFVYGMEALIAALPILLFGALVILSLWLLITAVTRWRARSEREYHAAAARHVALQAAKEENNSGADDTGC